LLGLAAREDVQVVVGFLRRIYWVHMGQELPVYSVGQMEKPATMLSLTRPHRWTLRMEPIRKRKFLEKLLHDWQQSERRDSQAIEEEFVRVKRELQAAVQSLRDAEYNSLIKQNVRLVAEVGTERLRVDATKRLLQRFVPDVEEVLQQAVIAAKEQELRGSPPAGGHDRRSLEATAEAFANNGIAQIFRQGPRPCERCRKLKQLLEAHPAIDKVRCAHAEDALAEARSAEAHLLQQVEPLRKEVLMLRALVSHAFTALADESKPSSDRIREAVELLGPLAHVQPSPPAPVRPKGNLPGEASSASPEDEQQPPLHSTEYLTVREEISALRTLLRETSNLHMAELLDMRREVEAYDAHMLAVLADAIDHHQPLPGLSAVRAASAIFDSSKQAFGKSLVSGSPLQFLWEDDRIRGDEPSQSDSKYSPFQSVRWARSH
jgi:hypothetical protein